MSALLAKIHQLRKTIEDDWSEELDKFPIKMGTDFIYDSTYSIRVKNILMAYVVLAFDNHSEWMEVHKDRRKVKFGILSRLGADIKDEFFVSVVNGENAAVQKLATWYSLFQRDYRWDDIRANNDYHAEMMAFAGMKTPSTRVFEEFEEDAEGKPQSVIVTEAIDMDKQISNNIKKAACIAAGADAKKRAISLLEEIQREYVNVDTALHKEGAPRLTELVDIIKWEPFIKQLRAKVVD